MTPSQLSAIRERLDAATPGPWELWYGELDWVSVGIDGDTVAECRTHINHQFSGWQNLRNATFIQHAPSDLRALMDEVERLTNDLAMARQVSGELCEACGWAMKFPGEPCRCELLKWRDEWEAFKAHVSEVQQAAFRRGANAMREAAAKVCDDMRSAARTDDPAWVGCRKACAEDIRALPIPEDR